MHRMPSQEEKFHSHNKSPEINHVYKQNMLHDGAIVHGSLWRTSEIREIKQIYFDMYGKS